MSKNMTPAQVAAKIAKFKAKQEATLKKYPVGPMANSARINLNKAEAALASLQETNEGMRIGKQPQAQMGAPIPNDMNYMQARYGGHTVPKYDGGGNTGNPYELGLRNLNPGNIRSWGDRPVVDGFAKFDTLEEGWIALQQQLQKYQGTRGKPSKSGITGESTLAEAMGKYAPHFENDTAGYINRLVGYLNRGGVEITADTPISEIPTEEWASAISLVESPEAYAALESSGYLSENISTALSGDTAVVNARSIVAPFLNDFPGSFELIAPSEESETSSIPAAEVDNSNDVSNANSLMFAEPIVEEGVYDETPGERPSEAVAVLNENGVPVPASGFVGIPGQAPGVMPYEDKGGIPSIGDSRVAHSKESYNALSKEEKEAYWAGTDVNTPMDLNFHRAELIGDGEPIFTEDNRFAYAQNKHGDWNVYDSQTGHHSMVRHANMLGDKGDSAAWRQAVAADGIAYDPQVNGADTADDKSLMFRYNNFGAQTMGNEGSESRGGMAHGYAARQGGVVWGNDIDFDTAIDGNLAAMGIVEPTWTERNNTAPFLNTDRSTWSPEKLAQVKDVEERQAIYDAAKLKEQQKAYANPGSYEFTLTADDQKSYMEKFGDWLIDKTVESPIGQMAGMEPQEAAGPTKFRGVGGYDPFTDYLSYEAYDDALAMPTETAEQRKAQEKAIKDSKALTNRWQRKGKTDNIIGNLFTPASLMTLEKKIGETFVKGSQTVGRGGLQSGFKGIRGQGSITGTARQNAIQSGKLQLPAGAPQLPPAINNYIPNTIPSNFIQNPITGRMAGRTKGIKDAFRTSGGLLDDYVPQLGDDFANTMGRSLDDFFPGAAKPGSNLPGLKGFKPPATTGNFPALSSNLPSVTSKLPQTLKFGQNLGRGPQGFQSYSLLDDLGLAVGRNAGAQMGGVWSSAIRDDYDPRRFGSLFAKKPGEDIIPGDKDGGGDGGINKDLLETGEDGTGVKIKKGDWSTGDSDKYNLDMGNPSALMAIPGLASLASARMQGRALENMQGPPKPITSMMHQFNYKSNIGQQLQEVKDASNAVMQNTNLQGQQMAALNQSVAAQRLKSNSGLLQQDAEQEQKARAQYDTMSMHVRMANDALRNSYLEDSTNFKNKKEMLQTQVKAQPFNVLASSAQDYLQNVYKSNLAAQMEAIGRPYDTGYDEEGNPT